MKKHEAGNNQEKKEFILVWVALLGGIPEPTATLEREEQSNE